MKKIVFGITSLGLGGAERVLVDIANKICDNYDVTIFSLYGNGEFVSQLSKKVKFISVFKNSYNELSNIKRKMISIQLVVSFFRNQIYNKYFKGKYDIEVAFLEGPITWIMAGKGDAKKIAWIHNDIEDVFGKDKGVSLKQKLNKKSYQNYNNLVFVSKDNMQKFNEYFPDINVNMRVIYNYINVDNVRKKSQAFKPLEIDKKSLSFVQVSRLVEQKAIFRLLDVHKKLIDEGLDHHIYIVGDGPLKSKITNKINEYKVADSFHLLGKKENPYPYIEAANYFILMSYYEGYPAVLLEAGALNKYIAITDSAAREALLGYNNCQITKNSEKGIYECLKSIILNPPKVVKSENDLNKKILNEIIDLLEG